MRNQDDRNLLVIEETSLRYFKDAERAEILALKAKLQSKIKNPPQDPNRTFSHAVQVHGESNVACGLWAEYLVQDSEENILNSRLKIFRKKKIITKKD